MVIDEGRSFDFFRQGRVLGETEMQSRVTTQAGKAYRIVVVRPVVLSEKDVFMDVDGVLGRFKDYWCFF